MSHCPYLRRGDEVEVTIPELSMRGALFPAAVVCAAAASERNKVVVEYETLLLSRSGGGLRAVREPAEAAMLRPVPPRERSYEFRFGDHVDAFFSGGWWEGAVTRVMEGSRFMVFFRFAKQEFEFGKEELRLHKEWINRIWVPPLVGEEEEGRSKATQAELNTKLTKCFKEGAVVEVTCDEEGYQGAWFSATVVTICEEKLLVKYESIRTDDDTGFLMEEVSPRYVRPLPPAAAVAGGFTLNEEVDAWYNDGWWEGVVAKVLRGPTYRVYFRGTDDEMEFPRSKLRRHHDWINEKWILAPKNRISSSGFEVMIAEGS